MQVVQDEHQRAYHVGDLGEQAAHRELGACPRLVRGQVRDRGPGAEHRAERRYEVDERVRTWPRRLHQAVADGTAVAPGESGERGGHGRVRHAGLETTGEHQPGYLRRERVEDRRLADARVTGQAQRRGLPAGGDLFVDGTQPGQPRLPTVEPGRQPEQR